MSPYFKEADRSVEGEINYGAQLTCQGRSKEIRLGGGEVGKPDRDIWVMFQTHQPLSSSNRLSHGARHEYKMAGKNTVSTRFLISQTGLTDTTEIRPQIGWTRTLGVSDNETQEKLMTESSEMGDEPRGNRIV